jgi:small subunit ribosomal protein S11
MATKPVTTKKKAKAKGKVRQGNVYIQSSYNNTMVTITDPIGNVLAWSSAGRVGFSGARKATPYAAQKVVADAIDRLRPYGMEEARVFVRGIGSARESAIRSLSVAGLNITAIRDITPIPHNGVRPPKRRRV